MLTAPHLNYALLAPILIVLGGALFGVLAEAFLSKTLRARVQLPIALLTLAAAFVQIIRIRNERSLSAAVSSVSIDGAGVPEYRNIIFLLAFSGVIVSVSYLSFKFIWTEF